MITLVGLASEKVQFKPFCIETRLSLKKDYKFSQLNRLRTTYIGQCVHEPQYYGEAPLSECLHVLTDQVQK